MVGTQRASVGGSGLRPDRGITLPADTREWERLYPDAWEELQERTAILMDARMVQSRAERAAIDIVRQRWAKGGR